MCVLYHSKYRMLKRCIVSKRMISNIVVPLQL